MFSRRDEDEPGRPGASHIIRLRARRSARQEPVTPQRPSVSISGGGRQVPKRRASWEFRTEQLGAAATRTRKRAAGSSHDLDGDPFQAVFHAGPRFALLLTEWYFAQLAGPRCIVDFYFRILLSLTYQPLHADLRPVRLTFTTGLAVIHGWAD